MYYEVQTSGHQSSKINQFNGKNYKALKTPTQLIQLKKLLKNHK